MNLAMVMKGNMKKMGCRDDEVKKKKRGEEYKREMTEDEEYRSNPIL